jgi:hypothetical protein
MATEIKVRLRHFMEAISKLPKAADWWNKHRDRPIHMLVFQDVKMTDFITEKTHGSDTTSEPTMMGDYVKLAFEVDPRDWTWYCKQTITITEDI